MGQRLKKEPLGSASGGGLGGDGGGRGGGGCKQREARECESGPEPACACRAWGLSSLPGAPAHGSQPDAHRGRRGGRRRRRLLAGQAQVRRGGHRLGSGHHVGLHQSWHALRLAAAGMPQPKGERLSERGRRRGGRGQLVGSQPATRAPTQLCWIPAVHSSSMHSSSMHAGPAASAQETYNVCAVAHEGACAAIKVGRSAAARGKLQARLRALLARDRALTGGAVVYCVRAAADAAHVVRVGLQQGQCGGRGVRRQHVCRGRRRACARRRAKPVDPPQTLTAPKLCPISCRTHSTSHGKLVGLLAWLPFHSTA